MRDANMKPTAKMTPKLLAALAIAATVLCGWKLCPLPRSTPDTAAAIPSEPPTAASTYEILEPESWVGKPFPILDHIDIRDQITQGNWLLLLYHHDCPDCIDAIARYEQTARDLAGNEDLLQIAFIEVPPFSHEPITPNRPCLQGRLADTTEWFVTTPAVVLLNNGQVRSAWESNAPSIDTILKEITTKNNQQFKRQPVTAAVHNT